MKKTKSSKKIALKITMSMTHGIGEFWIPAIVYMSGTWYFSNFFFVIFHDFLRCFTPPLLSLSFTRQEKTIHVLLIP